MKLAIMQPYFLPYIGYFQLINAVDTFVLLDDVNYINKGWINRNQLLLNGKAHLFTLPLEKASQNKLINQITLSKETKWLDKLLKTIETAYKKAPQYPMVFPIIEKILQYPENNLSLFIHHSLKQILQYLDIQKNMLFSSQLPKNPKAKAQERILDICNLLNAQIYINPIGGTELYDKKIFSEKNILLFFLKSLPLHYKQFNNEFIACLSIMDVMMFNKKNDIKEMLNNYQLL